MTDDKIIRCPRCDGTSFVPTLIGATGARAEFQPLPRGAEGLRCEACQRRYVLLGATLKAGD